MTHYDTIGAAPGADHQQLRRAYLARARRLHPDQFSHRPDAERAKAERAMQELNAAWSVLSDPQRRRAYDASLRTGSVSNPRATSPLVDGRSAPWRPFDPSSPPTPPRAHRSVPRVADPRDMEVRGTARLLRPGVLLALFGAMTALVVIAALVAGRGDDTITEPSPVVLPTGTPIGCIVISPVAQQVPCGDHDAVVWSIIDGGETCGEGFEAIYRSGQGGAFCVTREDRAEG